VFPPTDRLPDRERERLDAFLTKSGFRLRGDENSVPKLAKMRSMYEPYVYALAVFLMMPLPAWVHREDARDNWQGTA